MSQYVTPFCDHESSSDDDTETVVGPTSNERHMAPGWTSDRIESDTPVRVIRLGVDMLNGCTVRTPRQPTRFTYDEKRQHRYVNICRSLSTGS